MIQLPLWFKLSSVSGAFLVLMWLIIVLNFSLVFMPLAKEIEVQATYSEIERIKSILLHEGKVLEQLTLDWAIWDDTYKYITSRYPDYESSNLTKSSLQVLSLNAFFFYDLNYQVVWGKTWDFEKDAPLYLPQLPVEAPPEKIFLDNLTLSKLPGSHDSNTGLISTDNGIMLVSAYPSVGSDNVKSPNGFVLMGRLLYGQLLDDIRHRANVQLSLHSLTTPRLAPHLTVARNQISTGDPVYVNRISDTQILAYALLKDVSGKSSILLEVQLDRTIMPLASRTLTSNLQLTSILLLVAVGLFAVLIYGFVIKPIHALERFISYATELQLDENLPKPKLPNDEIGNLGRQFCQLIEKLRKRTSELNSLSLKDDLTGIANRRMANAYLEKLTKILREPKQPLALLLCDIDHFKMYNDFYGHAAGDTSLKEVADALRRSANKRHDLVARWGGEEFLVILPNTTVQEAKTVAARIINEVVALKLPHEKSPTHEFITISCGVDGEVQDNASIAERIQRVDIALYQAKANGRNNFFNNT